MREPPIVLVVGALSRHPFTAATELLRQLAEDLAQVRIAVLPLPPWPWPWPEWEEWFGRTDRFNADLLEYWFRWPRRRYPGWFEDPYWRHEFRMILDRLTARGEVRGIALLVPFDGDDGFDEFYDFLRSNDIRRPVILLTVGLVDRSLGERPPGVSFHYPEDRSGLLRFLGRSGELPPPDALLLPPALPPPSAAPPPRQTALLSALLAIGAVALWGLSRLASGTTSSPGQVPSPGHRLAVLFVLLAAFLTAIPSVARRISGRRGYAARLSLETALCTIFLVAFSFLIYGASGIGVWIAYSASVTVVLLGGSYLVEHIMTRHIQRASRRFRIAELTDAKEIIERIISREAIVYASVPLGLVVGAIGSLVLGWSVSLIINWTIVTVLGLSSVALLLFLIRSSICLAAPLITYSDIDSANFLEKTSSSPITLFSAAGTPLKVLLPISNSQEYDLEAAEAVCELRSVFLLNSLHNVILLVLFSATALNLIGPRPRVSAAVLMLIGATFVFVHLPYVIGQTRLQSRILERYTGSTKVTFGDQVKKAAPLIPAGEFLTAITSAAGVGGLLILLVQQFVRDAAK
jgi:hypothetical protein